MAVATRVFVTDATRNIESAVIAAPVSMLCRPNPSRYTISPSLTTPTARPASSSVVTISRATALVVSAAHRRSTMLTPLVPVLARLGYDYDNRGSYLRLRWFVDGYREFHGRELAVRIRAAWPDPGSRYVLGQSWRRRHGSAVRGTGRTGWRGLRPRHQSCTAARVSQWAAGSLGAVCRHRRLAA